MMREFQTGGNFFAPRCTSALEIESVSKKLNCKLFAIFRPVLQMAPFTLMLPSFRVREDLHAVDGHQGRAEGDHIPGDEDFRVEMKRKIILTFRIKLRKSLLSKRKVYARFAKPL